MSTLRPLNDRIIVKRDLRSSTTAGGIYIPSSVDKPVKGEVVDVGNGTFDEDGVRIPLNVTVGDIVLFGKTAGTEVTVDGKEFLVLRESEVMAIIEN